MRPARAILAVAALSILLAACGSTSGSPDPAASSGPWSFTDGSGEVVKADKTPDPDHRARR